MTRAERDELNEDETGPVTFEGLQGLIAKLERGGALSRAERLLNAQALDLLYVVLLRELHEKRRGRPRSAWTEVLAKVADKLIERNGVQVKAAIGAALGAGGEAKLIERVRRARLRLRARSDWKGMQVSEVLVRDAERRLLPPRRK